MGVRVLYVHEAGGCSLVEFMLPPSGGQAPPPHLHRRTEEVLFVVEGRIHVRIGDGDIVAEPGATVRVRPGAPHTFWNASDGLATVLSTCVPAGIERFFIELAAG